MFEFSLAGIAKMLIVVFCVLAVGTLIVDEVVTAMNISNTSDFYPIIQSIPSTMVTCTGLIGVGCIVVIATYVLRTIGLV